MADTTPKPTERQARTPLPREGGDDKKPALRTPADADPADRRRAARGELRLDGADRARSGGAAEGPVQPDVPGAGSRGQRRADLDAGGDRRRSLQEEVKYGKADANKVFETEIPSFANSEELSELLEDENVVIEAEAVNQSRGFLASLILGFGPVILLIGLFVYFARRAGGGGMSAIGAFGRSKARRVEGGEQKITFEDVAGIDEAKAELSEIVDFLKNPERYQKLGGRIPKGVLLSGRPGTGKTLLARAVAGRRARRSSPSPLPSSSKPSSASAPAASATCSSRPRKAAPAIIFIDELDAIGRSRSAGASFGGGNDEREQTLNQILTEMDGFESNVAVIVLGATNRPEILDAALLRPGRFDRRIAVAAPDREGRAKILGVHTRSLPLADGRQPRPPRGHDARHGRRGSREPGQRGRPDGRAAACTKGRDERLHRRAGEDRPRRPARHGPEREDRKRVAYHEAGHALVGMLTPGADPVRKVSIIPRGQALGVTFAAPDDDRANYEESWLTAKIKVALGGRVAEEVVFGTITTGAESDIQQLTRSPAAWSAGGG
jgi:cell division protease FtsH